MTNKEAFENIVNLARSQNAKAFEFVAKIAALKKDSEHGEEGISNDDAVDALDSLIEEARELFFAPSPHESEDA